MTNRYCACGRRKLPGRGAVPNPEAREQIIQRLAIVRELKMREATRQPFDKYAYLKLVYEEQLLQEQLAHLIYS